MKVKILDDLSVEFERGKKVYKNGRVFYSYCIDSGRIPFSFIILSSRGFDLERIKSIALVIEDLNLTYLTDIVFVVGDENALKYLSEVYRDRPYKAIVSHSAGNPVFSSLKCGLKAVSMRSKGAVVIFANRPAPTVATLKKIVDATLSGGEIVIPVKNGKRTHPIAISKDMFETLKNLRKEKGLPYILRKDLDRVKEVMVE